MVHAAATATALAVTPMADRVYLDVDTSTLEGTDPLVQVRDQQSGRVLASLAHEYRSKTLYPLSQAAGGFVETSVPDSRVYNFHLEIRIVSAVLSYQFRNIQGVPYQLVPGYLMPRLNQFYGVRWEFWN